MTPAEIETMAREGYNAIGDSFWSSMEIMNLIYKACMELVTQNVFVIEKTFEITTVVSQKEYDKPSNLMAMKRLIYDKYRVHPMSFEEYESFTGNDLESTFEGTPSHYLEWNGRFILYPIPNEVKALKAYCYVYPQPVSINTVLEVPEYSHPAIVDFVLSRMFGKEKEYGSLMKYHSDKWENEKLQFRAAKKLQKAQDGYPRVQLEEELSQYFTGKVL